MKSTFLVVFTTTDSTFEHTFYELFDDLVSCNEYIKHRFARDANDNVIKLNDNFCVIRTSCILADDIDDAQERCENILLSMFLMDELS